MLQDYVPDNPSNYGHSGFSGFEWVSIDCKRRDTDTIECAYVKMAVSTHLNELKCENKVTQHFSHYVDT